MRALEALARIPGYLQEAAMPGPNRPSSTRIIYLATGFAGLGAAVVLSGAFAWVYVRRGVADASFAAAVSTLWATLIGFASSSQNRKHEQERLLMKKGVEP